MSRLFRMSALLAAVVAFILIAINLGCGGGGGGTPPPSGEKRSVNSPGNTVEATFGSRNGFSNNLALRWIGDTTGTDYGVAKVATLTKVSGTADLSIVAGGLISLINDKAYDTIVFDFSAVHPAGTGDPDAGKAITGRATVHITPDSARVLPVAVLDMAQEGSVTLTAQAQNSRAQGWDVYVASAKTRLFVNVPEVTWATTTGLTLVNLGEGKVTVTGKTGFAGIATVTATYPGTGEKKTVTITVIPHPTVGVSSPIEGATVKGEVTVLFVVTNVTKTTYQLGASTEVDVTGLTNFKFDSKVLVNGPLAITMRATGKLETAVLVRNVTVDNTTVALKKGHLVLDGPPVYTDSDGQNIPNYVGGKATGLMYAFGGSRLTLMTEAGVVTNRISVGVADRATCFVDNTKQLAIPDQDNKKLLVYSSTGNLVKTISGLGTVWGADYYGGKVLVASTFGVHEFDPSNNWSQRFLFSGDFGAASGNGTVIFAMSYSDNHTRMYDYTGNRLKDLGVLGSVLSIRIMPEWNLVVASVPSGPKGTGIYSFDLEGTETGFTQGALTGNGPPSWEGTDRDYTDQNLLWGATGQTSRPFLQAFRIVE